MRTQALARLQATAAELDVDRQRLETLIKQIRQLRKNLKGARQTDDQSDQVYNMQKRMNALQDARDKVKQKIHKKTKKPGQGLDVEQQ